MSNKPIKIENLENLEELTNEEFSSIQGGTRISLNAQMGVMDTDYVLEMKVSVGNFMLLEDWKPKAIKHYPMPIHWNPKPIHYYPQPHQFGPISININVEIAHINFSYAIM